MCDCMENTFSPFARLANLIPEVEREAITAAVTKTYSHTHTQSDMYTMFRVWNTYVTPGEPQDMNCPGCRSNVVNKLRQVVTIWMDGN